MTVMQNCLKMGVLSMLTLMQVIRDRDIVVTNIRGHRATKKMEKVWHMECQEAEGKDQWQVWTGMAALESLVEMQEQVDCVLVL